MIGIGKQREAQMMLVIKFFLGFRGIRTDSEDCYVFVTQFFTCVPHTFSLGGSAGGIGFGVEKKKKFLPGKIGNPDILAILIF